MKKPNMKVINQEAKPMTVRLRDIDGNIIKEATQKTFLSPSEMRHEIARKLEDPENIDLLIATERIEILI